MEIKTATEEFRGVCLTILEREGLPLELVYRIRRIMDLFLPVTDKMYLKTVKGLETISLCTGQAKAIPAYLPAGGNPLYRQVTELENTLGELLRSAYEFRVKAG
ncbi:MAG: hypothetical protein HY892_15285 [Deltaproteobacteria bacterium]|nr:hypothetical protein [Deltaproteobacteria bacterium]